MTTNKKIALLWNYVNNTHGLLNDLKVISSEIKDDLNGRGIKEHKIKGFLDAREVVTELNHADIMRYFDTQLSYIENNLFTIYGLLDDLKKDKDEVSEVSDDLDKEKALDEFFK